MARSFIDKLLMRDADAEPASEDRQWARKSIKGRFGINKNMVSAPYHWIVDGLSDTYEVSGVTFTRSPHSFNRVFEAMINEEKRAIRNADPKGNKRMIDGSLLLRLPSDQLMKEGLDVTSSFSRLINDRVIAIAPQAALDASVADKLVDLSRRASNLLDAQQAAGFYTRGKSAADGSITLRHLIPERLQATLKGKFKVARFGKDEYHVLSGDALMEGEVDVEKIINAQKFDIRRDEKKREAERVASLKKLGVDVRKDPSFISRQADGSARISIPMRAKGLSKFFEEAGAKVTASGANLSVVMSLEDTKKIEPMFPWIKAELDAVTNHRNFDGSEKAMHSRLKKAVEKSSGQQLHDMSDLFNPASPISLFNPLSPLNPLNPIYASQSGGAVCVEPTSDYSPSSGSSWSASDYSSSSSSSYDSGSSSSYDSGSSSSPSCD